VNGIAASPSQPDPSVPPRLRRSLFTTKDAKNTKGTKEAHLKVAEVLGDYPVRRRRSFDLLSTLIAFLRVSFVYFVSFVVKKS
jgi:hypothetical protein